MSKIDHSLFTGTKTALKEAFGHCPECGGELGIKRGKNGAFIGCLNYPQCDYKKTLSHLPSPEVIKEIEGSECPECGGILVIKKGRYGLFIGCTHFPECHHHEPINKSDDTQIMCPVCKEGHLVARTNKFGKSFFACNGYPKCKYILNSPPVKRTCPKCDWPIMVEKNTSQGRILECPQKQCHHKERVE
ncbi:DNA topoisomerase family protein [Alteromonas sp. a30]|uniref:DNA topoisomerase family protein n=1 Tax=Alteromonas sp. a30 TaxID=2730917 RepID=UPI002280114D|nr:topoisomerase DNA-binding C4 zinc finger domain-containing protein [Alteromonas sp. a30]MCY7295445.1 hypothetical protein [Alteromonas sp. a30]